jgi:hypothetical protein
VKDLSVDQESDVVDRLRVRVTEVMPAAWAGLVRLVVGR